LTSGGGFGAGVAQDGGLLSDFGIVGPEEEVAAFGLAFLACVDLIIACVSEKSAGRSDELADLHHRPWFTPPFFV